MTTKERVFSALEGRPAGPTPVTSPYVGLFQLDHFGEYTGRPNWHWAQWMNAGPADYLRVFREMHRQTPFDILQPHGAPSHGERESVEVVEKNGKPWRHDRRNDSWTSLETVSGHAMDFAANEERHVRTRGDADRMMRPTPVRQALESGRYDYVRAVVEGMGADHFVLSGGVIGTLFSVQPFTGESALLEMMVEDPGLLDYIARKALASSIEEVRALAACGGHGIFVDESLATSDAISPAQYERFCLPVTRALVEEIHRHGHQAFVYYFGGVADRLDLVAATGADVVGVEASMKGYVNDLPDIARKLGNRVAVLGNVDPLGTLEQGTGSELEAEVRRQAGAREFARGYLASTGSPITPRTTLGRVREFLEVAAKY
ncbi:MAG: uroporphyrinogen decarboxylase family protein [Candidatus Coatesbacteria bacterium]